MTGKTDPALAERDRDRAEVAEADDDLPVVARMVVEIRSDGSRTIARGAVDDRLGDQQVAVEARADSPLELSLALAKMLLAGLRTREQAIDVGDAKTPTLAGRLRDRIARELEARVGKRLGPDSET